MSDSNYITETMRKLKELFKEKEVEHTKKQRIINLDNGQKVIVENKRREVKHVCS